MLNRCFYQLTCYLSCCLCPGHKLSGHKPWSFQEQLLIHSISSCYWIIWSIWIQWRSDFFQLGVLRSIRIKKIVLDLSISEITGDINFTFVCKAFYHKSICMNSQCKGMEITNNYFICCDIFHLTVLWKELAVVCITDGLISHNLEFESTAEPSCIALSLPHQAPLPALELRHSVHPWSSRGGLGLCILRNRCFSDFQANLFLLPAFWEWDCIFIFYFSFQEWAAG